MGVTISVPTGTGYRDAPISGIVSSDGFRANPAMALVDNNGMPVTSLKVSAGGPAAGQAAKNYSGVATLSGSTQTITLETVTTGKTYFITDIAITTTASAAILVQITAGGVPIFQTHINATKGIEALGIETQPYAAAGIVVALVIPSGTGAVAYNILGVEG
jgi:hypothetical protein